jgi:hypothetical protein
MYRRTSNHGGEGDAGQADRDAGVALRVEPDLSLDLESKRSYNAPAAARGLLLEEAISVPGMLDVFAESPGAAVRPANASAAPLATPALRHLDAVVDRPRAEAQLVGEAEAEAGLPGVHRQYNGEGRVQPERQSLEKRRHRALVAHP